MIQPGVLLQNRYRVVKQIGQGGMGAVYVATDERFQSTVALKQTFFDDPALRKAFEREAHLLNHLRHSALTKVSDHFNEDAGQFLVMEFVEGPDLSELLQQRDSFPLVDVMRWADELLDALDYLHTHEPPVVHRDIKPQNMKLTPRGQIMLLDFGLAKGATTMTHANTSASVFGYSRNYAPLEQIQGTGTDPRSDLYSLGATLYHLLTGNAPVDALTRANAVINNQLDPLRPAHLGKSQVPESISRILQRAMALKSALRYGTAAEMRSALRLAASAIPQVKASAQEQRSRYDTTIVDGETPASAGQQAAALNSRFSVQGQRQPGSPARDETTLLNPSLDATRPAIKTYSYSSIQTPAQLPPQKSTAKLIGVVGVVLLIACAAVFALTRSSGGEASPGNDAQLETQPGSTATAMPADSTTATQERNAGASPGTQSFTEDTHALSRAPASPGTGDASSSAGQPVMVGNGATGASNSTAASANVRTTVPGGTDSAPSATSVPVNKPQVVVQATVPAPDNGTVASPDIQRATQPQDMPPPPRPGEERFPPPGSGRQPPPPPGGGFPPGDGQRPPPPRRP